MKKGLILSAMVAILVFVGIANGQYPECPIVPNSNILYSLPDFGGLTHYWVRYWNAGARYGWTGNIKEMPWPKKDAWDGIAYDGRFLFNPQVSPRERRVYFRLDANDDPRGRYFMPWQVVNDPRLTNWWWTFATDQAKTLWEAVENGALTKNFPGVTKAIVDHMVDCGVVAKQEFRRMSPERILEAIADYTAIALRHNLDKVREIIGKDRLTEERFQLLKQGDKLLSYYWYRYGPYPLVENELTVTGRNKDEILVTFGGKKKFPIKWEQIKEIAEFFTVKTVKVK